MSVTRSTYVEMQDERIRQDVTHQIDWEPEIHSQDVSVKVDRANVTLTGFVHGD